LFRRESSWILPLSMLPTDDNLARFNSELESHRPSFMSDK
jgi:hypothetical protein